MAVQNINFIKDQIYFSKKVGILMKGTSDDETPIPGYLHQEITDLSYQSPTHCEFLLEFMVKRLSKTSCHVKYKTLKLMKHLVEKGEPAFRKGLHKKSGCIQEATKFGGPPHPLHGNVPYQAVRQTAKELSAVLCELNMSKAEESQQLHNQPPERKLGGIGPAKSNPGGKYHGFGNTPLEKKSLGSTIVERIEKLADQLGETADQRQAALMAQLEKNSGGDYVPPVMPPLPPSALVSKVALPVKKAVPKSYAPGRAGGGWDDAADREQRQGSETPSEGSCELSDRLEAVSVADWSAEEQLVTECLFTDITTPFIYLQPSMLKVFKQKYQSLNCEKVVEFINKKMKSTEDHLVVRAMLLLETFLFRNDAVSLDYIVSVCQEQLNYVANFSPDQRCLDKAEKIIFILERYSSHPSLRAPRDQQGTD